MKKTFKMEDLDCANCAAKMEALIRKIDGVADCSVNFLAQKMILDADDENFDEIVRKAVAAVHKIDADCTVIVR